MYKIFFGGNILKKLASIFLYLSLVCLFFNTDANASTKKMAVHFIDVGQGDAIYIKTPNGDDILIDAGNKSKGNQVVSYLKKQKVDDIEVIIATHPDADHIGGLDEVLDAYKVENIYAPKVSHTTQAYQDFLHAVKREGKKIKTAKQSTKLSLKGIEAKFIGPTKEYSTSDLNNWSAVLYVKYNKNSFLFTGDAESKAEQDMLSKNVLSKTDVLKVAHHGAKEATTTAFLNKVKPTYSVISVGKGNRYGHPTNEVLNRLKAVKSKVYRTDKQGTVIATSDGSNITFNVKPSANYSNSSTTSKTKTTKSYKLSANVTPKNPKQYGTVKLKISGVPSGTKYKAVFHYKSTNTTYTGKVGNTLNVRIGRAAKNYKVTIDISATYKGKTYKTTSSFTPK